MHKPRLARLADLHVRQPTYFLTLCTFERKPILARPSAHAAFLEFCRNATDHGVHVGRYVLMPDHLHLFALFSLGGTSLSLWAKSLKNTLSKTWRSENVATPHWQKGFFDHVLRSAESYAEKWSYVKENPGRAGLVKVSSDWPYQGEIVDLNGRDVRRS